MFMAEHRVISISVTDGVVLWRTSFKPAATIYIVTLTMPHQHQQPTPMVQLLPGQHQGIS